MASVSGEETCRQCYYYKKVYVGGFNCEHPEANNTRVFTTFGKCDRFTRYEKKKLTCKNCKYYDEVNPDWTYAKSSTFRCNKRQCNMTSLSAMCSNGPFLPEEEKEGKEKEHKCEICGKSCDGRWPEHEHKWMCVECHWGLHDDSDGTVTLTMPEAKKGKFYDFKIQPNCAKMFKPSSMLHNHIYLKGNKMRKLVKVLRRVIMLWVVYGAVKLGILVNPLIMRFGMFVCTGDKHSELNNIQINVLGWLFCIAGIVAFCAASYALHKFSAWIFNEGK